MRNKRRLLVLNVLVLVVSAAAFIAGRFLNQNINSAQSISVTIVPALELPTTSPAVTGSFVERQDNALLIESRSLEIDGGVALQAPGARREAGPRVEVVVTNQTVIYRETTQLNELLSSGNQTIQQTVEEAALDALDIGFMVMAWGRNSGDRIIAEVLMYSDTQMMKRGLFEDCDVCP